MTSGRPGGDRERLHPFGEPRADFDEYCGRYANVEMSRSEGILVARLHTDGEPLVWGDRPHSQLGHCFADIGSDPANRVIVITGTGDAFCEGLDSSWVGTMTPELWGRIYSNGVRLLTNLLAIEVPVVAAVNGPARVHAELGVLADVVVASETAYFQDSPHFRFGAVPGDGVQAVWPALLGPNRGRYFLLTGQKLSAREALDLGVVGEVVPPEAVLSRALEVARDLCKQPDSTLRYTKAALVQQLRRTILETVPAGLALEGLGAHAFWPAADE